MISIIIPIYKVEKYLPKCLDSVLNQTYEDLEIILVDDGSPDACPKICDEYALKDSRIKVIHQKNSGVSAARNAGLKNASGKFIGFIDPDDWIMPDMYQLMVNAIINCDLVICGYNYFNEQYEIDSKRIYVERQNEVLSQKDLMSRFGDMPPTIRHGVVNKLFKRELIDCLCFDETLHASEDVLFLNEYVKRSKSAVMIHRGSYCNLVRSGSATHGGLGIQSLADSFMAHEEMYRTAVRFYPELKDHSLAFLLDACTLKYNIAKKRYQGLNEPNKDLYKQLCKMRRFIKKYALQGMFDNEIYWKTRIYYCLLR